MILVRPCAVCGVYHDELIVARLVLVSGKVVTRYICSGCYSEIKNMIKKGRYYDTIKS